MQLKLDVFKLKFFRLKSIILLLGRIGCVILICCLLFHSCSLSLFLAQIELVGRHIRIFDILNRPIHESSFFFIDELDELVDQLKLNLRIVLARLIDEFFLQDCQVLFQRHWIQFLALYLAVTTLIKELWQVFLPIHQIHANKHISNQLSWKAIIFHFSVNSDEELRKFLSWRPRHVLRLILGFNGTLVLKCWPVVLVDPSLLILLKDALYPSRADT